MLKKFFIFISKILIFTNFLFIIFTTISNSKVIGNIQNLNGKLFYFFNGQEIELGVLDEIEINISYLLSELGEVTIELDDNTTLIFSKGAEFLFNNFNGIYTSDPFFELTILKGEMLIETGEIPKLTKDKTIIHSPNGDLFLNGTAVSTSFIGNRSEIYLLKDTLGNVGELRLSNGQSEDLNFEVNQGFSFQGDVIEKTVASEEKLNGLENLKKAIVDSVLLNEEKIEKIIRDKIKSGKLKDKNGDGVVDQSDIDNLKQKLINQKENKLNSLIANTSTDTSMITSVITNSEGQSSSMVLNKVIENNPSITSNILNEIIEFSEDKLDIIKDSDESLFNKVLETVVDQSDEEDTNIINIISKADNNTSSFILEKISNDKEELLANIVIETSKINSSKINNLIEQNDEMQNKVTEAIVESIENDPSSEEKLKELMISTDANLSSKIIDSVKDNDPEIVSKAVKLAIEENQEKLEENLAKSLSKKTSFSEIILKEVILSGEKEIINNAVDKALGSSESASPTNSNSNQINEDQNEELEENTEVEVQQLSLISSVIQETTEELILNEEIPEDENILLEIKEVLVSPN